MAYADAPLLLVQWIEPGRDSAHVVMTRDNVRAHTLAERKRALGHTALVQLAPLPRPIGEEIQDPFEPMASAHDYGCR